LTRARSTAGLISGTSVAGLIRARLGLAAQPGASLPIVLNRLQNLPARLNPSKRRGRARAGGRVRMQSDFARLEAPLSGNPTRAGAPASAPAKRIFVIAVTSRVQGSR
jgi:hypothetical protein